MIFHGEDIKPVSESQLKDLLQLKELYQFWNNQINVISRKDMDNFYLHHVLHSLAIAQVYDFNNNHQVMDLGCGGGFPGIPLAICFPDVQFHMVDSIGKKIKVVLEVAKSLQLKNITAEHGRAENIRDRKFDCVISRAVAPLSSLLRWSTPLINHKNKQAYGLICLKGGDLAEEISNIHRKVYIHKIYPAIFKDSWFDDKFVLQVRI